MDSNKQKQRHKKALSKVSLKRKLKRKSSPKGNPYRGVTTEISLKLILSWAIALAAIVSLFRLLPYHLSQQAKLKELRIQVEETDARVTKLREQLNHNFDPQRTQSLMEQYSSLTSPNQSRIYWLPEENKKTKNQE
ncbi:MAG: hypothetical protein ACFCAD_13675 [Pleurocapsa sp.]